MYTTFDALYPDEFERRPDWPVDVGIAAGCTLGYLLTWVGLICFLYLEHWMAGLLGALAGGIVGWLWFLVKVRHGSERKSA